MLDSKFSLTQAYYKGGKIVVDNFMFFIVATVIGSLAVVFYLTALGIIDFMLLKNHIYSLVKLFQETATSATGSLHHEDFAMHTAIAKHIPQDLLQQFMDMDVVSFNIAKEDISKIITWVIPTALLLKLFVDMMMVGWIKIALDLNANKKVTFKYLFEYYYLTPRVFLANLVIGLATIAGLMLFIVPGIFVYQRLRFAKFFIIDKNLSIVKALQSSWSFTQGSVLELTGFSLISLMLSNIANFVFILKVFVLPVQNQTETNIYQQLLNK
jgi:hypothetical protein